MEPEAVLWCIACGQVSRAKEWAGQCPRCGASLRSGLEWEYVRGIAPGLPETPEPGEVYRLSDYR